MMWLVTSLVQSVQDAKQRYSFGRVFRAQMRSNNMQWQSFCGLGQPLSSPEPRKGYEFWNIETYCSLYLFCSAWPLQCDMKSSRQSWEDSNYSKSLGMYCQLCTLPNTNILPMVEWASHPLLFDHGDALKFRTSVKMLTQIIGLWRLINRSKG